MSKSIAWAIRQRCNLQMFAAIYVDTPPHWVERGITSFPCSAISPQRSLSPQYHSSTTADDDDDDSSAVDDDDILSQWSMSPGPPSPCSDTWLQRSLNPPHDSDTDSSVDDDCDGGDITTTTATSCRLVWIIVSKSHFYKQQTRSDMSKLLMSSSMVVGLHCHSN